MSFYTRAAACASGLLFLREVAARAGCGCWGAGRLVGEDAAGRAQTGRWPANRRSCQLRARLFHVIPSQCARRREARAGRCASQMRPSSRCNLQAPLPAHPAQIQFRAQDRLHPRANPARSVLVRLRLCEYIATLPCMPLAHCVLMNIYRLADLRAYSLFCKASANPPYLFPPLFLSIGIRAYMLQVQTVCLCVPLMHTGRHAQEIYETPWAPMSDRYEQVAVIVLPAQEPQIWCDLQCTSVPFWNYAKVSPDEMKTTFSWVRHTMFPSRYAAT